LVQTARFSVHVESISVIVMLLPKAPFSESPQCATVSACICPGLWMSQKCIRIGIIVFRNDPCLVVLKPRVCIWRFSDCKGRSIVDDLLEVTLSVHPPSSSPGVRVLKPSRDRHNHLFRAALSHGQPQLKQNCLHHLVVFGTRTGPNSM